MAACAVGSAGKVIISDNLPGRATSDMADDVARTVSTVVARFGLKETRELKKYYNQPCTMERACIWTPEGKPWLDPWVYAFLAHDGRVHVGIEKRNAWYSEQVKQITQEVANELRVRFGSESVSIDMDY